MQTVPTKLTDKLVIEIEDLIKDGWYANKSELIRDAVRDLISKTKMQKLETAIKEDITWGLHGK
jgi:putative addiction module CopG family antidote|tara:strand:+ start:13157 stop:13348 length:192 start_codon:yes stop_codon:yes gene_type:complete